MKILFLAEFDPAGVLLSHRDVLRSAGGDARVAVQSAYTERHQDADWIAEQTTAPNAFGHGKRPSGFGSPSLDYAPHPRCTAGAVSELRDFAWEADCIVVAPGIGQPWADRGAAFQPSLDPPLARYFGIDWQPLLRWDPRPRLVAYFHGSVYTRQHVAQYAEHYRSRGYDLACSTLDYAALLPATYLPPEITVPESYGRAPLRGDDDPLIVAHCPTNPAIASTAEFLHIARKLGIVVRYVHQRPHAESLAAKAGSHATFDHLRGTFSVNSIEAAALGSVPLFAWHPEFHDAPAPREMWINAGFVHPIDTGDLRAILGALADAPDLTRGCQLAARAWYERHFTRAPVLARLRAFYGC